MNYDLFFLQIVKLLIVLMGSVLIWLSYKGYKRTNRKSMIFLLAGFVFLTAGSGIEGILFEILNFDLVFSALVEAVLVGIGFLCFIYSIYGNFE